MNKTFYNPRTCEYEVAVETKHEQAKPITGFYDTSQKNIQEKELLAQIKILTETIMSLTKKVKNLARTIK